MWPWRVKMPTQNLLMLYLLLMRIVLATICCRLWCWGSVKKLNFCSEHKVWLRFWSWSSGKICSWSLAIFLLMFCRGYEVESWLRIVNFKFSRDTDVWLKFWSWCMVEILKMKFDQELCLNLWYDLDYIGKLNSTLGSVVNFAMFFCLYLRKDFQEKHLTAGSRFLICSFSYCKLMSIKDKNASLLPVLRALLGKSFCIGQCPRNFVFFIAEKMSPWRNAIRYDLHLIQQMITQFDCTGVECFDWGRGGREKLPIEYSKEEKVKEDIFVGEC